MFETVMYMGHPDIRQFIVLIALMKTGHKASHPPDLRVPYLFLSSFFLHVLHTVPFAKAKQVLYSAHQNSVAAHADLIRRTDCTILLHSRGFPTSAIAQHCRMETLCVPDMEYLLDDSAPCDHYPYEKSWDEAKHHPCLVVHMPSSSGFPKPVVWTQSSLMISDSYNMVPPLDGRPFLWKAVLATPTRRFFAGVSIFEGAGIPFGIRKVVFHNGVLVLSPPGPVTADIFDQYLDYADIDAAGSLPSTLEEISTRPDILVKLRKLGSITYYGRKKMPH